MTTNPKPLGQACTALYTPVYIGNRHLPKPPSSLMVFLE